MGNLLRLLSRDADSCCSIAKPADLFVDFESAQPTEEEAELYNEVEEVLIKAALILKQLQEYKGASKEIKEAIGLATPEAEGVAWEAVKPLVSTLKDFYEFSNLLRLTLPKILNALCSSSPEALGNGNTRISIIETLDEHQALVKQLAKILDFALKFDECKMITPAVQNDLSYYRRTTQRSHRNNANLANDIISIDVANGMSLFFAHATPMVNTLSTVTSKFVADNENSVARNTTEMLSVMAKICQKMLESEDMKSRLKYEDTQQFILRVMVASIILFDHVDRTGAFAKGSSVDVKGCVKVLKDQEKTQAESLLNALRYTTKHLNEESTPKNIKSLLFEDLA